MKLKNILPLFFVSLFSPLFPQNIRLSSFAADLFFPAYGAEADASIYVDKSDISAGKVSACGGYFSAKPNLSKFSADLYSGWGEVKVSSPKLDFSVGTFGAGLPGETKILNGKPRFLLKNGEFSGVYSSFAYHFQEDVSLEAEILALDGGFEWGDLYYFYGHPRNIEVCAGKTAISVPFGIDFSGFFARLKTDIQADNTDESASLGKASVNFFVLSLKKQLAGLDGSFMQSQRHFLSAGVLYCYADLSGSVLATSETQDYFFFPYEKIFGSANDIFHIAGLGFSYEYVRSLFDFKLDTIYLHCFSNEAAANYSYKYKKNIFFDGSRGGDDFNLAEFKNCGLFAGKAELSCKLKKIMNLKRTSPELKLSRIFVIPILTENAKSSLMHNASSKGFADSASDSGFSSSRALNKIKTVLLAGTVFSLEIRF